jgi:hypothetical protein
MNVALETASIEEWTARRNLNRYLVNIKLEGSGKVIQQHTVCLPNASVLRDT